VDKRVWRVLKAYHVHVGGRGGAFMQVEMKDIDKGTKTNQRFRTEDKIERAFVDPRDMQYLYQDGDSYVFMDQENYEQMSLSAEFLEARRASCCRTPKCRSTSTTAAPSAWSCRPRSSSPSRTPSPASRTPPHQQLQAGKDGDRHHGAGAALHQQGRENQDRHRRGHLHGARQLGQLLQRLLGLPVGHALAQVASALLPHFFEPFRSL